MVNNVFIYLEDFFGPPLLGKKTPYDFTNVSMSVVKRVVSKTAHGIFLKLLMKLWCLNGKIWRSRVLWKKSQFVDNVQKHPQNRVFWILKKKKIIDV